MNVCMYIWLFVFICLFVCVCVCVCVCFLSKIRKWAITLPDIEYTSIIDMQNIVHTISSLSLCLSFCLSVLRSLKKLFNP